MFGRIGVILKSWMNALLGRAENPPLILDLAYEEFQTQLVDVKRAVADVATSKFQTEKQVEKARAEIDKLYSQAQAELQDGNDDLAMRLLERKAQADIRLAELQTDLAELQHKQAELERNSQDLEDQIDEFGRKKEVDKAQYRTAQAQVQFGETVAGINKTGAAVNRALGRMEEKQELLEARAQAIPELIANGTLPTVISGGKSRLELEAESSQVKREASKELAAMRQRLGLPAPKPQELSQQN